MIEGVKVKKGEMKKFRAEITLHNFVYELKAKDEKEARLKACIELWDEIKRTLHRTPTLVSNIKLRRIR